MANIFIIDDEPNILFVLKEILSESGHRIITASNGINGLAKLKNNPNQDVILLDLKMPDLDGKEVIKLMNCDNDLKNIPKVIMSGSMPDFGDFPPKNSYQDIISKPFDLFEAVEKIESLCSTRNTAN